MAKKTATGGSGKATTGTAKGKSGPRELITPKKGGRSRYQRRAADGQFGDADDVGKSLKADRQTKSKSKAPRGEGDKGDHPKK